MGQRSKRAVPGEADYVVVGAGSAGCVLAARLAGSGARVVLIEAGGSDRTALVRKPGLIAAVHSVPQLKARLDWGYYSVPQSDALERKIPQTRGKVLGGSGSVNGMLFVRGNAANYDSWAAEGCDGWSYADVLPSFKKLESWEEGETEFRGGAGPIKVRRQTDVTTATLGFMEAFAETAGVKVLDDYNGESQEGIAIVQQSAHDGLRYSSSVGYLDDHGMAQLGVVTGMTVARVVLEKGRAVGVEVVGEDGVRQVVRATREVVLCAGVFGSAQLLQLSGIGPAEHLRSVGVEVVQDLPVGDNLHDHLFVPMCFLMPEARNKGTAPYFARGFVKEMTRGGTWVGRTVFESVGFVRGPNAEQRAGPADPCAAVVLSRTESGRADPAQGRPAADADGDADADLPPQPRDPAPGVGRPARRAADRPGVPARAGGHPAAAGRDGDGPRGDGAPLTVRARAGRELAGHDVREPRGARRRAAEPRDDGVPPGGHVPHGRRRARGGGPGPAGAGDRRAAGRGRLDHAEHRRREHERRGADDRGACGGADAGVRGEAVGEARLGRFRAGLPVAR